jgi:hypothetical protein
MKTNNPSTEGEDAIPRSLMAKPNKQTVSSDFQCVCDEPDGGAVSRKDPGLFEPFISNSIRPAIRSSGWLRRGSEEWRRGRDSHSTPSSLRAGFSPLLSYLKKASSSLRWPPHNSFFVCGAKCLSDSLPPFSRHSSQIQFGGEEGIRTLETLAGLPAFQASALDHYATSP